MTLWLTVKQFADKQNKNLMTIYKWNDNGFLVSLGFLVQRDFTGHIRIGIPSDHPSYRDFAT